MINRQLLRSRAPMPSALLRSPPRRSMFVTAPAATPQSTACGRGPSMPSRARGDLPGQAHDAVAIDPGLGTEVTKTPVTPFLASATQPQLKDGRDSEEGACSAPVRR